MEPCHGDKGVGGAVFSSQCLPKFSGQISKGKVLLTDRLTAEEGKQLAKGYLFNHPKAPEATERNPFHSSWASRSTRHFIPLLCVEDFFSLFISAHFCSNVVLFILSVA